MAAPDPVHRPRPPPLVVVPTAVAPPPARPRRPLPRFAMPAAVVPLHRLGTSGSDLTAASPPARRCPPPSLVASVVAATSPTARLLPPVPLVALMAAVAPPSTPVGHCPRTAAKPPALGFGPAAAPGFPPTAWAAGLPVPARPSERLTASIAAERLRRVSAGEQRQRASRRSAITEAMLRQDRLLSASALRAKRQCSMGLFEADTSPFAFDPNTGPMVDYFRSIPCVIEAGVPASTLSRDATAWRRWTDFCALVPTPPWRLDVNAHSGADAAGADRESRLLCAFLLYCYEIIQPRSSKSKAAKPSSAYQMVDGVRRVHRRAGIFMVSAKRLTMIMNGITAAHIKEHGAESLVVQRKDPLGPSLTRALLNTAHGTVLGSRKLDWSSTLFLNLGAMFALSVGTGFRKAEVALPSGVELDDRRLHRSSVKWQIDGVIFADPSPEQLKCMVRGRDKAIIIPPPSKADQDGTVWGAHPIWQVYDDRDVANAALWLQRLELAAPCHNGARLRTALFVSESSTPMLQSTVDTYLRHLLVANVPAEKVDSYSFHSFRIGFACALLAAKCPYDMIQALARWRSDKSVAIYARLNPEDYTSWVAKALQQETTSTTTARMPVVIDDHERVAMLQAVGALYTEAATAP